MATKLLLFIVSSPFQLLLWILLAINFFLIDGIAPAAAVVAIH
jgi:hypothetical protein